MEKVLVSWSGGKDSAMALYEILKDPGYQVAALLTTVTEGVDRISMHGVRSNLLRQQVVALGFPLETVYIPKAASNKSYEMAMEHLLRRYKEIGVQRVVFGDIFLEDLRKYREDNLAKVDMSGIYPLWQRDTRELASAFISAGFKAITTCIDTTALDRHFAGRVIDDVFLSELPANVDPCGENGEFHSFVFDGPLFKNKISFSTGEMHWRYERFYDCDLISD